MSKRLFVGGVSHDTTKDEIRSFFETVGSVVQVYYPKDPMKPDRHRGFAFVEMKTDDEASAAIEMLNGKVGPCGKRKIAVKVALDSEGYQQKRAFSDHERNKSNYT